MDIQSFRSKSPFSSLISPTLRPRCWLLVTWLWPLGASLAQIQSPPVQMESLPDAQSDGVEAVISWSQQRLEQAKADYVLQGHERMKSPWRWSEQTVYHVLLDRFANADPNNDNFQPHPLPPIADMRHGGDLAGLIDRLDYLVELGIDTLWVSPPLQHDGSYHGYCTTNPTQIDPGFGTNEQFKTLVQLAHQKGMLVIMDVVLNHLCDRNTSYVRPPRHFACVNTRHQQFLQGDMEQNIHQGVLQFGSTMFPPLKHPAFFHRCGANSWEETSQEHPASLYGDFVEGMFDLHTSHPVVQEVLTNVHLWWIAYADIDGFRVDAAKHMGEDFIAYFSTHSRDFARQLGKENFFLIGEVAGSQQLQEARLSHMTSARLAMLHRNNNPYNPYNPYASLPESVANTLTQLEPIYNMHQHAPYPGLNAVFDFTTSGLARKVLRREIDVGELTSHLQSPSAQSLYYTGGTSNWHLLETHDWPRFASNKYGSERTSALAIAYLALSPRVPVIYYGMEQAFNGDCHWFTMNVGPATAATQALCQRAEEHVLARQDMFVTGPWRLGSMVPSIDSLAAIGPATAPMPQAWQQDPMLDRTHVVYQTARRWLSLRKEARILRSGQMEIHEHASSNPNLLVFSRTLGDQEIIIALNLSAQEQAIPDITLSNHVMRNPRRLPRPRVPGAMGQPEPIETTTFVNMTHPQQQVISSWSYVVPTFENRFPTPPNPKSSNPKSSNPPKTPSKEPPGRNRTAPPFSPYPPSWMPMRVQHLLSFTNITLQGHAIAVFAPQHRLGPWQEDLGRLTYKDELPNN